MFSPKVILWGGLAGLFSGLFWMMAGSGGIVLALVLGLGGLAGLYSRQTGQGGKLGLAGFALGIIGTVLALATLWGGFPSGGFSNVKSDPAAAAPAALILSLGMIILGMGLALLGLASLRSKTLSRWRGLPLGLGLLNAIQGVTIVLFGYIALSQGRNPWHVWPQGYTLILVEFVLLGLGWIGLGAILVADGNAQIPVAQPPVETA